MLQSVHTHTDTQWRLHSHTNRLQVEGIQCVEYSKWLTAEGSDQALQLTRKAQLLFLKLSAEATSVLLSARVNQRVYEGGKQDVNRSGLIVTLPVNWNYKRLKRTGTINVEALKYGAEIKCFPSDFQNMRTTIQGLTSLSLRQNQPFFKKRKLCHEVYFFIRPFIWLPHSASVLWEESLYLVESVFKIVFSILWLFQPLRMPQGLNKPSCRGIKHIEISQTFKDWQEPVQMELVCFYIGRPVGQCYLWGNHMLIYIY